jgi:hypothetical protein
MKLLLLSIFYCFSLSSPTHKDLTTSHAIYVSVLEIEQGSLKVKVFANDLEDAIYNHCQQRLDLLTGNCSQSKSLIDNYFSDHLAVKIDGQERKFSYKTCEVNDISLWLTFEFNTPAKWRKVEITADYLMELFPTQSNVVSVSYLKEKRMFRLTKGATTETISF